MRENDIVSSMSQYYDAIRNLNGNNLLRLKVIEWLVSDRKEDRRTGRTTMLALAFIRAASDNLEPKKVFDHFAGYDELNNMRQTIAFLDPSAVFRNDGRSVLLSVDPKPAVPERGYPSRLAEEQTISGLQSLTDDLGSICVALVAFGLKEDVIINFVRRKIRENAVRSVMKG